MIAAAYSIKQIACLLSKRKEQNSHVAWNSPSCFRALRRAQLHRLGNPLKSLKMESSKAKRGRREPTQRNTLHCNDHCFSTAAHSKHFKRRAERKIYGISPGHASDNKVHVLFLVSRFTAIFALYFHFYFKVQSLYKELQHS